MVLFDYIHPRLGPVSVEFAVSPAEPEVGIMGMWLDGYNLFQDGKNITEKLTITESNEMEELILKRMETMARSAD